MEDEQTIQAQPVQSSESPKWLSVLGIFAHQELLLALGALIPSSILAGVWVALREGSMQDFWKTQLFVLGVLFVIPTAGAFLRMASLFVDDLFLFLGALGSAIGMGGSEIVPVDEQAVSLDAVPSSQTRFEKHVVDLVPHFRSGRQSVIQVGDVEVDARDFSQFLARAWETNGVKDKGLTREWWLPEGQAGYVFQRDDGTSLTCTREYYDAILQKLLTLGEVEGRARGWSGKLKRDPKEWLVRLRYI